jgi:hypothetical protein
VIGRKISRETEAKIDELMLASTRLANATKDYFESQPLGMAGSAAFTRWADSSDRRRLKGEVERRAVVLRQAVMAVETGLEADERRD